MMAPESFPPMRTGAGCRLLVSSALALVVLMGATLSTPAMAASPGDVGYRYATKAERNKLKRQTSGKVKKQRGWFISKGGGSWAVVCGRTKNKPELHGTSFRKSGGRWKYKPPITSGGMQTVSYLCNYI